MNLLLTTQQRSWFEERAQLQDWQREIDDDLRLSQLQKDAQKEINDRINQ